jgi:predicted CXXCH cytochrome family protein
MIRSKKRSAALALGIVAVLGSFGGALAREGILASPHNLSITGGGGAHNISYDEIRVCVFCHTPHNAVDTGLVSIAPLWNRALPPEGQSYSMYQSDTFKANVNPQPTAPTGASRVCLSCHDGTLALNSYGGKVLHGSGAGSSYLKMPTDSDSSKNANLGTDLADDHPISFPYTADLAYKMNLVAPAGLPASIKLDSGGNLQCTACHDPHDDQYGNFLVMNNGDPNKPGYNPTVTSPLCVSCHTPPGWDNSSPHYAGEGCLNCHATHSSPVKEYLLKAPVDQVCFNGAGCHNGTDNQAQHAAGLVSGALAGTRSADMAAPETQRPAAQHSSGNLEGLFSRAFYKHPIGLNGASYQVNQQLPLRTPRVECVDCHNSHVSGSSSVMAGRIKRSLKMVKGISKDTLGSVDASHEYEICYKCHSGSFAYKFVGVDKPNRVIGETDQMKRFDPANPSYHPVAALRRGNGASLLAQYQSSMLSIECSDCHNSDESKKAGGSGPNGPHGSRYPHILMARYEMPLKSGRGAAGSGYRSDYALCFTCHSDIYVMTSGTSFMNGSVNEHQSHVVTFGIPCFACHDPHGVPAQDGATRANGAHLINFDRSYAASPSVPVPRYLSSGTASGSCTVSCHSGTRSYSP